MKKTVFYRAPIAIYMIVLFIVSVRPMPEGLPEVNNIDKVYHLSAYFILGLLWARSLALPSADGGRRTRWRVIIAATAISFVFGAFIEFCQYFTPYRSAEIGDAIANGTGGLLGSFVYSRFISRSGS